jgi:hypothetical protein
LLHRNGGAAIAACPEEHRMRDVESSLQAFGEFLLKGQLVRQNAAPYFVRWVRRFPRSG